MDSANSIGSKDHKNSVASVDKEYILSDEESVQSEPSEEKSSYAYDLVSSATLLASEYALKTSARALQFLKDVDWSKHADSLKNTVHTVALTSRAAAIAYGPDPLASIAAATDWSSKSRFYETHTLQERIYRFNELKKKYPFLIPVYIYKMRGSQLPPLAKNRYLAPPNMPIYSLVKNVSEKMMLASHQAIFMRAIIITGIDDTCGSSLFSIPYTEKEGNLITAVREDLSSFYERNKSNDGFLYLIIREENVFGC